MFRSLVCLIVGVALCAVVAAAPVSQLFRAEGHGRKADGYFPDDDIRRITAVHDVETPHVVWARPLAGGPVRVLAIAAKTDGRWPVELAQRFDFDVRTVYGHDPSRLGAPPGRGLFVQGQSDVEARILKALADDIDVVVSNIAWGALGERVQQRIEAHAAQGMGYIGPTEGWPLSDLERDEETAVALVAETIPLAGLRLLGGRYDSAEAAADEIIQLWAGEDGPRVADMSTYPRDGEKPDPGRLQYAWLPRAEQEAYFSLLGRAILWVARRPFQVPESLWPDAPLVFARNELPLAFAGGSRSEAAFRVRVWDADMRPVYAGTDANIPVLPAGQYFAGIEPFGEGSFTGWRFEAFEMVVDEAIAEVRLADPHLSPKDNAEVTVRIEGTPPEGGQFVFELFDNYGRCIYREERSAASEAVFSGPVHESLHLYNYANVQLLDANGTLLSEKRQGFYVAHPNMPTDEISVMIWEASASFHPVLRPVLERFAALGSNAALIGAYDGGTDTTVLEACAMANVHAVPYVTRLSAPQVGEDGIRRPTITSDEYKNPLKATLARQAEAFRPFSPFAYSLGDDQTYVSPGQDVGWSPSYRAILAEWAERQYGSIDALNEAWGTQFGAFTEVEPVRRAEAVQAALADPPDFRPFCHWVDHQLCQDEMLADWHREMADVVEAIDHNTVSWYDCTIQGWPQPGTAFDFWELGRQSRFCVQYPNPIVHDLWESVVSKDAYHGTWYGGYGLYNYYPYVDAEFLPWWSVFRGMNLHCLYYGGNSPQYFEERLLCPDLGPTISYERILQNLAELRSGTAKLLFNAEKQHDGIAVLYSAPSLHHVALFTEGLPKAPEWTGQASASDVFLYMHEWEGLALLLRDLGYDYQAVSWKMLEDGSFLDMGYRVLVLPFTLRLSDAQAETVRRFVADGGVVVADVFTGAFDGRAHLSERGMLADVLGLRFAPSLPGDDVVMETAALPDGLVLGEMAIDRDVTAETAEPRAFTENGVPLFFVNTFGEGWAVFLNMLCRDYQIWRTLGTEMPFRRAVGNLLAEVSGLAPEVDIQVEVRGPDESHRLQSSEIRRYTLGDGEYVGVLRHPKLRPDDSIWMADQRPKPGWMTFAREAHIYDMRRGMYRGFTNRIEDVFYPGRAELYALLPYEVAGIALAAARDGQAFVIHGAIEPQDSAATVTDHVVHLRVRDPQGRDRPELARNVLAKGGRFEERFFLGYNASGGAWTLYARDAATGIERGAFLPVSTASRR